METERYIGVFCSANELPEKYTDPARELARLMVENGYHLVWGGSDTGLMNVIASSVKESGGKIIGVTVPHLRNVAREEADEMIFADDLNHRKDLMLEKSDAIVVLVGGVGTIDEVTHMLELKKQKLHFKPIVVLNTDNFYAGLRQQLELMHSEGFIKRDLAEMIYFADSPQEVLNYINDRLK